MEYNEDLLMGQTKLKIIAVGLAITSDGGKITLRSIFVAE